ncbi:FMN-binding negative transcriptional regulator [Cellulomonas sp. WB94]|uniref:FMN-binding negative transcriptional regulator n=1 Tax=Cellulomonas sp. WB94 TaxID=2173174 RepID=UPI002685B94C
MSDEPILAFMYTPAHFAPDSDASARFLADVVAGDLVISTDSGLVATFLPVLLDAGTSSRGSLVGHLARNNDQWQQAVRGEALFIAHGPDAYISPSWYASKAEHGRVVPTWNYATAHVYGELVVHDDTAWVGALVRRLTDRHEARREHPWSVDDAPARFTAGQLRAIVGVELVISRVEVKVKMSQNRPDRDIDGVVTGLGQDGRPDAAAMVDRSRS